MSILNPINQKSFYVSSPDVNKLIAQINAALQNGWGNTTNGLYSVISGGVNNITSADYAFIGSATGAAATLKGQVVNSSYTETPFISQASRFTLTKEITGNSATILTLTNNELPVMTLQSGVSAKAWNAFIQIVAICKETGTGTTVVNDVYSANFIATIKNNGAHVSMVGSQEQIGIEQADASMNNCTVTIRVDDPNLAMEIEFGPPTSANGNTKINVMASVTLAEIGW
jgi:hypothetical protein